MIELQSQMRVGLISCVKSKLPRAAAAGDLYVSPLFKGMRRYVEGNCDTWFILSAQHGLLDPDQVIQPYEKTLMRMKASERLEWGQGVQEQLRKMVPRGSDVVVLAGVRYRAEITAFLASRGHRVTVPLEGKKLGAQLSWLKEHAK